MRILNEILQLFRTFLVSRGSVMKEHVSCSLYQSLMRFSSSFRKCSKVSIKVHQFNDISTTFSVKIYILYSSKKTHIEIPSSGVLCINPQLLSPPNTVSTCKKTSEKNILTKIFTHELPKG